MFGNHNLLNLHAAYYACREIGISAKTFCSAIGGFSGASKRLEVLAENRNTVVYRDFAHAPSKLTATIRAVKQQFPERKLVAVFELHTYSSLTEAFLHEYAGSMEAADEAAVVYSKHGLELKQLPGLNPLTIAAGFERRDIKIFSDQKELLNWMGGFNYKDANLLLMSSGNFDGADMLTFAKQVTGT